MPPRGRDKGYKGTPSAKKPAPATLRYSQPGASATSATLRYSKYYANKPTTPDERQETRGGKGYQGHTNMQGTPQVSIPSPVQAWNYLMWLSEGGDRPPGMGDLYRHPREPQEYSPYRPPGANPYLDIRNSAVQEYMQKYTANNFRGRGPDKGYKGTGTKSPSASQYITLDDYLQIPGFNVPMTDANGNIIGDTGFGPFGPPVTEATQTAEPPPPEYPTGEYPYYPPYPGGGGGGGGYTYPTYSNPFYEYRQGYALEGTPAARTPELRGVGEPQRYGNYASQNQAARWIQLLTNWRI